MTIINYVVVQERKKMNDKLHVVNHPENNLENIPELITCSNCGSEVFIPTIILTKISALVSKKGIPDIGPLQGPLMCANCHNILTPDRIKGILNGTITNQSGLIYTKPDNSTEH